MLEGGALRTSFPGPWGPFHVAVTSRGIARFSSLLAEMLHDVEPKVSRVFESTALTTT